MLKTRYLNVRVSEKLYDALKQTAREEQRTLSDLVRTALQRAVSTQDEPEMVGTGNDDAN